MAWFFSSGPKTTVRRQPTNSAKKRTTNLIFDPLETRILPSGDVWLARQLQPVDGASQYNQSFQIFRPAKANLMPDLGMNTGTITLAGTFGLTATGEYSLSLAASGPYGGSDSYEFTESGTITFTLIEEGTVTLGGYSVGTVALTQAATLDWTFREKDAQGNTVQYLDGSESFTLEGAPSAPFDPLFWAGFAWLDPTWEVSSLNDLDLPELTESALTVSLDGSESFTFTVEDAVLTVTGNVTQPLYDKLGESGLQSYAVTVRETVDQTPHGNATFTLDELGSYSGGSFALSSVDYHETGSKEAPLTMTATRTDSGTVTASGQKDAAGNLHTFSSSSAETYHFTSVSTLAYSETAGNDYTLDESGTFGSGSFNLGNLSYSSSDGNGGFALTLTTGSTQTGNYSTTDQQAGTDSLGISGTLSSSGAATESANFTLTSIDTVTESESGTFSLTQEGGYGIGSWSVTTFMLTQTFSGSYSRQHTETFTAGGTGTLVSGNASNDSYTMHYGSVQTTSGVDSADIAETLTYTFTIIYTASSTSSASLSYSLTEIGSIQGGSYSLSCFVYSEGFQGSATFASHLTETLSGHGVAAGTMSKSGDYGSGYGGNTISSVNGGAVYIDREYFMTETSTESYNESSSYSESQFLRGIYAGGSFALSSVAFTENGSDSWSLVATQCSTETGSESNDGSKTANFSVSRSNGGLAGSGLSNGTISFSTDSNYTATASSGANQSGSVSWSLVERGTYGANSFAFSTVTYQAGGGFTATSTSAETYTWASDSDETQTSGGGQTNTANGNVDDGASIGTSLATTLRSISESGSANSSETRSSAAGWSEYDAGTYGGGSWNLSSVNYQESYSDDYSSQSNESYDSSGVITATSQATVISTGTSVYGGTIALVGTYTSSTTGWATFTESAEASAEASGSSWYAMSELGSFSGQSYAFSSVTYQGGDSFEEESTYAESGSEHGGQTATTHRINTRDISSRVGAVQVGTGLSEETSNTSFTTSGSQEYSETVSASGSSAYYGAGSYSGQSLSLTSYHYTDESASDWNYDSNSTMHVEGQVTLAADDGADGYATQNAGGNYIEFNQTSSSSSDFSGTMEEWNFESASGSGGQSASSEEMGIYSNFSFSLSTVIYQSTETYSEDGSVSGNSSESGTVADVTDVVGDTSKDGVQGMASSNLSVSKSTHATSSRYAEGESTFDEEYHSQGTTTLYQRGSFSGNSYNLSSVAYFESGHDTWHSSASEDASQYGQETRHMEGTFNSGGTLAYSGAGLSNAGGTTITYNQDIHGTSTSVSGETMGEGGGSNYSLSMQGVYSAYSYSFGTVVYQGVESGTMSVSGYESSSFTGDNSGSADKVTHGGDTVSLSGHSSTGTSSDNAGVSLSIEASGSSYESMSASFSYSDAWFQSGSYAGGSFAFASINETYSETDGFAAESSFESGETIAFSGGGEASSNYQSLNSEFSTTISSTSSSTEHANCTLNLVSSGQGSSTYHSGSSYTQNQQGSYANESYSFATWSYNGTQSASYSSDNSSSVTETLSATGSHSDNSASTYASIVGGMQAGGGHGGPSYVTYTVQDTSGSYNSTSFNGTISAHETRAHSASGNVELSSSYVGSFGGMSYSFSSMTYDFSSSNSWSDGDYSGFTVLDTMSVSESQSNSHLGFFGTTGYSCYHNFTRQDTFTSNATTTSDGSSEYHLYQGGGYSGQSWNLSSYNLHIEYHNDGTHSNHTQLASYKSGTFGATRTQPSGGAYRLVGDFVEASDVTTDTLDALSFGYELSQQGEFTGGKFIVDSMLYNSDDSDDYSMTMTTGSINTFSGADDIDLGESNPTFAGVETGTSSYEETGSSSGSMTQEGSFADGSFSLSTVIYEGSANTSFTSSEDRVSTWDGDYSGAETYSTSSSGYDAFMQGATGSFSGDSYSMSSYVMDGLATRSESLTHTRTQTVLGDTSSFSRFSSYDAADSFYQTGTMSAGDYSNTTYAYWDNAEETNTYGTESSEGSTAETWTETHGTTIILGGTQEHASAATYSADDGNTSDNKSTSESGSSAGPATAPLVQFAEPDERLVPVVSAAQRSGMDLTMGQGAAGAGATGAGSGAGSFGGEGSGAGSPSPLGGAASGVKSSTGAGDAPAGVTFSRAPVPIVIHSEGLMMGGRVISQHRHVARRTIKPPVDRVRIVVYDSSGSIIPLWGTAAQEVINLFSPDIRRSEGTTFGMLAWNAIHGVFDLAAWIGGDSIKETGKSLLSLADDSGRVAMVGNYQEFHSTSNDPYVAWVDKILDNGGQPLTAGSAGIYGTYFDPRAAAFINVLGHIDNYGILGAYVGLMMGNESIMSDFGALFGGSSSQSGVSAQQALSQIGPFLEFGINFEITMLTIGAAGGVQPLRGGIPGIGNNFRARAKCDGVVGKALQNYKGAALTGEVKPGPTFLEQNLSYLFRGERIRNTGPASWLELRQSCFTGKMLIDVPGGKKRAKDLQLGDLVASRNELDPCGPVEYKEVEEVFEQVSSILNLHVDGQVIETTPEHPFYVDGFGWLPAHLLEIGDLLLGRGGHIMPVEGVADSGRVETVYNWRIAEWHTYFVSSLAARHSIWVHNQYGVAQGQNHHAISRKVHRELENHSVLAGTYRFRDPRLATRARSLSDHVGYQRWHRRLDAAVEGWLRRNPRASRQQFEGFLRKMYGQGRLGQMFPNGL